MDKYKSSLDESSEAKHCRKVSFHGLCHWKKAFNMVIVQLYMFRLMLVNFFQNIAKHFKQSEDEEGYEIIQVQWTESMMCDQ